MKVTKKSNLETNTGHRFISKTKTCYKIHIHTPNDEILNRSVGFIKIGEVRGLKKAIFLRNEIGCAMWGKHWKRVLHDPTIFTRLPHSLEPKLIEKPCPTKSNPDQTRPYYIAKWLEYDENGSSTYKSKLTNVTAMGKLAAYSQAKRILLEAHAQNIDILLFMGRVNTLKLK